MWFLALVAGPAFAQNYTLTDLGIPGNVPNSAAEAHGVNQNGAVVGTWWDGSSSLGSQYAFLFANGTNFDLGTIKAGGYDYAVANAINNAGWIVGQGTTSGYYVYHAFLYTNGVMVDLDKTGQSWSSANAINQHGQIVGEFTTPAGLIHAFLYTNGAFLDLGTLGGSYSSAKGINDSGVIVGESSDANENTLAFVWSNGVMTSLGTLGSNYSSAAAINDAGVIAGESLLADGQVHAFIYSNGVMRDLGTLGGTNSTATAINNGGEVTGYALTTNEDAHAFLFSGATMRDLHQSFTPPANWTNMFLTLAYGINDAGQVVGGVNYVTNGATNYDAFLLTPPALTLTYPTDLTVTASGPTGAVVFFSATAAGGCSQATVTANPPSGSLFPIGTNTVNVTAADLCGHTNTGSFTVTVNPPPEPVAVTAPAFLVSNQFALTIQGVTGQKFVIQASPDLKNWTPLITNTLLNSWTNWTDLSTSTNSRRFYRAVTLP